MTDSSEQVRDHAFELFTVEAARVRLQDRVGDVRIVLRSGRVLVGELLTTAPIAGHLDLVDAGQRQVLVSTDAISMMRGSSSRLRDEATSGRTRTLASRLRETWASGLRLRALLRSGEWIDGAIVLVASDHVELAVGDGHCVIPFAASEAWDVGHAV